jgi:ABC-type Fe3+/spermidine/putrescine transport system ATPase subunit
VGSPEELYLDPANRFVTRFIGRSTALAGTVEEVAEGGDRVGVRVRLAAGPTWEGIVTDGEAAPEPGSPVELVVRPEALRLVRTAGGADAPSGALAGRVVSRRYGGPITYYRVAVDSPRGADEAENPVEVPLEIEVLAPSGAAAEGDPVRVFQLAQGPPARVFGPAPPAPERPA